MGGRDQCLDQWRRLFAENPGYSHTVDSLVVRGDQVYLSGDIVNAGGGSDEHALWRAGLQGGKIAEWQVYADNEPMRAMMRERTAK